MVGNLRNARGVVRRKTKGETTRATIVAAAARVFNVRGFAGTSMTDVLEATGLEKGGLYNHFASKDDLAVAAFDHAASVLEKQFSKALDGAGSASAKLDAVLDVFASMATRPLVRGGCPLLNTAVGTTNVHVRLRNRARDAFARATTRVANIVRHGVETGEFNALVDPPSVASVFVASLEGAVMLSRLYGEPEHMRRMTAHLRAEIARFTAPAGT